MLLSLRSRYSIVCTVQLCNHVAYCYVELCNQVARVLLTGLSGKSRQSSHDHRVCVELVTGR